MNIGEAIENWFEQSFRKRTATEKRKIKIARKIAHRGTNWKQLNKGSGKRGFTRVKATDGKTYVFKRQTGHEKVTKKRSGRKLGLAKWLRK